MNLDLKNKEWTEFLISDIFNISGTFTTHPSKLKKGGLTPRVTCAATNNGFENTYKNKPTEKGGVITIDSATVGYVSFQPYDFIATDHVEKISLKNNRLINKYLGAFLVRAISSATLNKYGYGYKFSQTRIAKQKIILPINQKGEPDFEFMEAFMKQKEQEKFQEYNDYISQRIKTLKDFKSVEPIEEKEWAEFFIADVSEILSGRDIYGSERIKGNTPYISATANNNGIGHFVGNDNPTKESGCLSVNRNGSVGYSFYHPYEALFGNDCRKLRPKNPSKHVGIFISQQITRQRGKYGYGYKMGTARLKRQKIMLPVNDQNEPDYDYMENYMKQLEYNKLNEYLKVKKTTR